MTDSTRHEDARAGQGNVARENITAIARLEHRAKGERSPWARMGDRIAGAAAGGWFLAVNIALFAAWLAINTGLVPGIAPFDPFPFTLLTLIVALETIVLTLFVLGSQKRLTEEADQRAHLDLQVSLLAEQEMTMMLRMLREVCEHHGLKETISSPKFQELVKLTDVTRLAEQLATHLPGPSDAPPEPRRD
jgi:uncharacterized membrane protein